jgi:hypothetical protein
MSLNCPACNAVIQQEAIDRRIAEINEKRLSAERDRDAAKAMAAKATTLGAQANGFDASADTMEMLDFRFSKAKTSGFEGDFLDWLGDAKGAKADPIASRLAAIAATAATAAPTPPPVAAAPPTPAPPAEPQAAVPVAAPVSRLPSAAPTVTAPTVSPRLTAEQIGKKNEPLKKDYAAAVQAGNKEKAAQIKAAMDANWKLAEDPA